MHYLVRTKVDAERLRRASHFAGLGGVLRYIVRMTDRSPKISTRLIHEGMLLPYMWKIDANAKQDVFNASGDSTPRERDCLTVELSKGIPKQFTIRKHAHSKIYFNRNAAGIPIALPMSMFRSFRKEHSFTIVSALLSNPRDCTIRSENPSPATSLFTSRLFFKWKLDIDHFTDDERFRFCFFVHSAISVHMSSTMDVYVVY